MKYEKTGKSHWELKKYFFSVIHVNVVCVIDEQITLYWLETTGHFIVYFVSIRIIQSSSKYLGVFATNTGNKTVCTGNFERE